MLVYINDIIVTGTHLDHIQILIHHLSQQFAMKDLGDLSYFIGIQAHRGNNGLHFNQQNYILDILHKAKMIGAKS